ncbi:cytochrome P450 [Schizophyllum fasciatum]
MAIDRLYLVVAASIVGLAAFLRSRRRRKQLPLPPGPRKLPLLGNLFDVPTKFEWEVYTRWSEEYGSDIIQFDAFGTSTVVLNSYEASVDLLEKRSRLYSNRPRFPMAVEMMHMDYNIALRPYDQEWRDRRRLIHGAMHASASSQYHSLQTKSAHAFIRAMCEAGDEDLEQGLRHMTGTTILNAAYGLNLSAKNDPHVTAAEQVVGVMSKAMLQGNYLVNIFPALKSIPEWVPGAGFKLEAREWLDKGWQMISEPFEEVKQRVADGKPVSPSFTSEALEKGEADAAVIDAAATMYIGGTDTMVVALLDFVLCMLDRPALQRRAQAELDAVLGPLRAEDSAWPVFADAPRLPFIAALVRESLRWKPAVPMGVPHSYIGTEPDVYKGYAIPSGSTVIANTWAMVHDEAVYPDSHTFRPERFLTADGQLDRGVRDPADIVFGFGRRVCPGSHFAYASIWVTIASVLRVCDIERAKGPDGRPIEPKREWRSGILLQPARYKCRFVPRNAAAAAMIEAAEGMDSE